MDLGAVLMDFGTCLRNFHSQTSFYGIINSEVLIKIMSDNLGMEDTNKTENINYNQNSDIQAKKDNVSKSYIIIRVYL